MSLRKVDLVKRMTQKQNWKQQNLKTVDYDRDKNIQATGINDGF